MPVDKYISSLKPFNISFHILITDLVTCVLCHLLLTR